MIHTLHLFPELDQKLLEVLRELNEEEWNSSTLAPLWSVKDVASHILDGTLRGISSSRDGYFGNAAPKSDDYQDLVDFLNQLNGDWVKVSRRLSPALLVQLLEQNLPLYVQHLQELDMEGLAIFSVDWAGESLSKSWFHIAREYTEKFHHQMQIRFAVGKDAELLQEKWYLPYLDTSMQGLPHHYRNISVEEGSTIGFKVSDISKNWGIRYANTQWTLTDQLDHLVAEVSIPKEIAWRIFTKGISREEARQSVEILGNAALGEKILDMIAVMA
ncbi:MAG: maleylpyruvate isomerase N-terminal domain-containing protein [Bacteroidia bacterium]|nr:maleylpyruvate isomerase N-terminal domain-containing protein [Bacteroidia bacterium]